LIFFTASGVNGEVGGELLAGFFGPFDEAACEIAFTESLRHMVSNLPPALLCDFCVNPV
jgi:hypothetical protein